MLSGRRIAGVIRPLVNARSLQLGYAGVLHESLLVPALRGLLGIRRMDKVSNARIRQLCGVTKGVDENINEGILRWFGLEGLCRIVCW